MRKLILDTDIGSDVDDALALALILGSEQINLLGITTVYGDTSLRAKIAMHLCKLVHRPIPTFPGATEALSGRKTWISGNEGKGFSNLDSFHVSSTNAKDFMIEAINHLPNQVDILAIGPLTNIALAISKSPNFAKHIKHLWIMGGDFTQVKVEHNFKCDVSAAKIVLESDIPISILDLPSSQKTILTLVEIERIKCAGALGPILYSEILSWIQPRDQDWTTPHDPIAALSLIDPELFDVTSKGRVRIDDEGKSFWTQDLQGNVNLISPNQPLEAVNRMIGYIENLK